MPAGRRASDGHLRRHQSRAGQRPAALPDDLHRPAGAAVHHGRRDHLARLRRARRAAAAGLARRRAAADRSRRRRALTSRRAYDDGVPVWYLYLETPRDKTRSLALDLDEPAAPGRCASRPAAGPAAAGRRTPAPAADRPPRHEPERQPRHGEGRPPMGGGLRDVRSELGQAALAATTTRDQSGSATPDEAGADEADRGDLGAGAGQLHAADAAAGGRLATGRTSCRHVEPAGTDGERTSPRVRGAPLRVDADEDQAVVARPRGPRGRRRAGDVARRVGDERAQQDRRRLGVAEAVAARLEAGALALDLVARLDFLPLPPALSP